MSNSPRITFWLELSLSYSYLVNVIDFLKKSLCLRKFNVVDQKKKKKFNVAQVKLLYKSQIHVNLIVKNNK